MACAEFPGTSPSGPADESVRKPGPPVARVVEREVEGCFALLCPDREHVLLLNETASDVWRLVDGELTLDAIASLLARAYGVKQESIYNDVQRAIALYYEHGLLGDPE